MAAYDSDSSDGIGDDLAETNVLLGYAIENEIEEDPISHLGGVPSWINPDSKPSASLARCQVCNELMVLLLQLNGELPKTFPGHERRLYVFSCKRKACRRKNGSIRAFRATRTSGVKDMPLKQSKSSNVPAARPPQANIGESLFAATSPVLVSRNANPFSLSSSTTASQPTPGEGREEDSRVFAETFAQKARISAPPPTPKPSKSVPTEPWPTLETFPKPYPLFHLDADYEVLEQSPQTIDSGANVKVDSDSAADVSEESAKEKEIFESSLDKSFQKFADRIAQNPTQVLRYEFGGDPLLYSSDDAVGRLFSRRNVSTGKVRATQQGGVSIPSCQYCGRSRVFELQLTPHAIAELESEETGLDGMDWGTIIVGLCSKDCGGESISVGDVSYHEEWVGVQWEETGQKK